MSDHLNTLRRGAPKAKADRSEDPPQKQFPLPSLAKFLPWLLLGAFILLAWLLFGERFERARPAELYKVVTMRASASADSNRAAAESDRGLNFEGSPLFQASGWIESDPLPMRVTTLYSGVVDEVLVLEGETVSKGQVIARMIDADARLDLETAQAALGQAEASVKERKAQRAAAEAALRTIDREIASAQSRLSELDDEATRLEKAGKAVFRESEITQAKLRVATQARRVEALESRLDELQSALAAARAAFEVAEASLAHARVEVARRELAFDRTQVRSPVAGRIQELYAAPGMKRMLNMDGLETATIAKVYQPESLQARIDVPLEEAARLAIGQPVRLRSSLLPNRTFRGQVTRIDGQADLQRNTLQAKVRLLEPDEQLRPEMLCRAEFLPVASKEGGQAASAGSSGRVNLYVPESALIDGGAEPRVWALDAGGKTVEQRSLQLGESRRDGYRLVREGLRPGDVVVLNPPGDLEAGDRVKDSGEGLLEKN